MGESKSGRVTVADAATVALALSAVAATIPAAGAAEIRRGADYVAVIVEAEDHATVDERWVLTDPSTPTQENDPDPNHTDGASGGEYLELLPDIRVKHGDPFGPPRGFWPQPGDGPQASYPVDFPEPGRYHVHARVFATGSEDNGIHFGLDGQWPDTAKALQACTAGERDWRWSSRRRHIGGWPCGVEKSIWLTIESAGTHTVTISAREDGFELDRFMLIKDLSDGTRTCEPARTRADDIVCRDGGIEVADDKVDLELELGFYVETEVEVKDRETGEFGTETEITIEEEPAEPLEVGDTAVIGVRVKNRDIYDDATATVVELDLPEGDWKLVGSSGGCERDGDAVLCELGTVRPTGVNDGKVVSLTLEALSGGLLPIGASVSAEQEDDDISDDARHLGVEVGSDVVPARLDVDVSKRPAAAATAGVETVEIDVDVRNVGDGEASDVVLTFELADGLDADGIPAACEASAGGANLTCVVGALDAGGSQRLSLGVTAEESGVYTLGVVAGGTNAATGEESVYLEFVAPTDGGTDSGEGETGGADSGVDSGGEAGGDGADSGTDSADGGTDGGTASGTDGSTDGADGGTDGADGGLDSGGEAGGDGADGGTGGTDGGDDSSGTSSGGLTDGDADGTTGGDGSGSDSGGTTSGDGTVTAGTVDAADGTDGTDGTDSEGSAGEGGETDGEADGGTESGDGSGDSSGDGAPDVEPVSKSSGGIGASGALAALALMLMAALRRRAG